MELFLILLKGFRPLYNVKRRSVLVAVGVLYLPLHFIIVITIIIIIIIIIITFIINTIAIIFIITSILIKNSLLFLWGKLTVWFCFFPFLHLS